MRPERRSPPVGDGEISPLALKRATQRAALAMLTPNRLAAALRDMAPSTTAPTTRLRRSSESAIPPPPSRGDNLQADQSRFGNPSPRFISLGYRSNEPSAGAWHNRPARSPSESGRECGLGGSTGHRMR